MAKNKETFMTVKEVLELDLAKARRDRDRIKKDISNLEGLVGDLERNIRRNHRLLQYNVSPQRRRDTEQNTRNSEHALNKYKEDLHKAQDKLRDVEHRISELKRKLKI